jgi:hypothetical protein
VQRGIRSDRQRRCRHPRTGTTRRSPTIRRN